MNPGSPSKPRFVAGKPNYVTGGRASQRVLCSAALAVIFSRTCEIGVEPIGVERAAVEELVGAKGEPALGRADGERLGHPALKLAARAREGDAGCGQGGAIDVGAEDGLGAGKSASLRAMWPVATICA